MEKAGTSWLLMGLAVCLIACGDAYSFMSVSQEIVTLEGESVTIQCEVANLGETQVVFWQNGSNVMAMARNVFSTDGGRIEIGGGGNIYDLVIHEVLLSDEGSYTCQIPGGEGTIKQKNMLTVNIPPYVELTPNMEEVHMEIGQKITLQCDAEGKPEPDVVWTLPDPDQLTDYTDTMDGPKLVLSNIQKEDAGEYTCTASNGAGDPVSKSILVRVNYPPIVSVENPVVYSGPGSDVTIECTFDASPAVDVIWSHNSSDIDFGTRDNIQTNVRSLDHGKEVQILEISNMRGSDLGMYRCDGQNNYGTDYTDVELSALPHGMEIDTKKAGAHSHQYNLKWHVMSGPPILDFLFMVKEVNVSGPSKWRNTTLHSSKAQYMLPKYEEEHMLENLESNSTYVVRLRARNAYGTSEWSERFRFTTSDGTPASAAKSGNDVDGGMVGGASTVFASTSIAALFLSALSLLMLA